MKNLLIFGAGELQESIIQTARAHGLFTVGIDPDPKAIGQRILDQFEQIAGDDFKKTCDIVEKYKIDGIVTAATDKPLLMMAQIAEKYEFPFPSVKSISMSTNKYLMKKAFISHRIPCARGELVNNLETATKQILNYDFPLIIKPTDSSGSRGVLLCSKPDEVIDNFIKTSSYSSNSDVLIEEYIDGRELSVEGIIVNGNLIVVQFTDKLVSEPPYNVEIGHIQPANLSNDQKNEILRILGKVALALELNHCAIHAELKISSRGIVVIEIGARLGGDFITSHLTPLSCGINIEKVLCDIAIGKDPEIVRSKSEFSMINYLNLPTGIFMEFKESNAIQRLCHNFHFNLSIGDEVRAVKNSLERYGHFIITGENLSEILRKRDAINTILRQNITIYEQN